MPVSITDMNLLTGHIWKKSVCFDSLSIGLTSYMSTQTIPDLFSVVSNALPIDITTAFVEVSDIKHKVRSYIIDISNLVGTAFSTSTGGIAKILMSMYNDDKTVDIMYVRMSYDLDASLFDSRVSQEPCYVQFCLKLPQSVHHSSSKTTTVIGTLSKYFCHHQLDHHLIRKKNNTLFSKASESSDKLSSFSSSLSSNITTFTVVMPSSPNMNHLLQLSGGSTSSTVSYYGYMTFLDDQSLFHTVCGKKLCLYGYRPN